MNYRYNFSFDEIINIINNNPLASKTFRYYASRDKNCFLNHCIRFICEDEDYNFLGYGHLDYDDNLWLGMFVSDTNIGKGFGKKIFKKLINSTNLDIHLTVDKNNIPAINLYLNNGFKIYKQTDKIYYCKLAR